MAKPIIKHPQGCTDLGRLFTYIGKEEARKRREEYLKGNNPAPKKGEEGNENHRRPKHRE